MARAARSKKVPISVLILTYNEEETIRDCIRSVDRASEVVVFDSGSEDRTQEIAKSQGARVVEHPFSNYAEQRNAALRKVEYSHEWVLMLDADERATDELFLEIKGSVIGAVDIDMFRLRRKDVLFGKWLRHATGYPTWFGRVVRPGRVSVIRPVNEQYVATGKEGRLESHLLHYPMSKGLHRWIERHNEYSTMEAQVRSGGLKPWKSEVMKLLSGNEIERRQALKTLSYRVPLRPLAVFVYFVVWRRGIFDGIAGLRYCCLRAWYEYMIDLKIWELEHSDP